MIDLLMIKDYSPLLTFDIQHTAKFLTWLEKK